MNEIYMETRPDARGEFERPDDFLKVRETLSRIGVASRKD